MTDTTTKETLAHRWPLALTVADEDWEPIGPDDEDELMPAERADFERWSRIMYEPGVTINGVGFHLEGWAVTNVADHQLADYDDDGLGLLHTAVGADGSFETVEIRGREYVLVMSPYC